MPTEFAALATYDSVVLVDVPRTRLTDRQLAALQVYVRDLGKGLVMIGGPDSYGAGGYQKTPLEETLPVDMGVRDRQKQPDVALVVVIDQSGSMDACHCNSFDGGMGGGTGVGGVRKVDIGKEAILRAAAALTERDELGVVSFNEQAHWVVRTQPLGGINDLQGAIAGLQPLGPDQHLRGPRAGRGVARGRDRHPPPHHPADRRLVELRAVRRDPRADEGRRASRSRRSGRAEAPTRSSRASRRRAAGASTTPPTRRSIPDIFLKETQQVSGEQIVEEPFFPILTSSSPIMRGLDQGLPRLRGYNGTTAKPAAQTVLVTARDDPLLAQWQYGLGRSVAWTSDSTGRWARDWVGWDGFSRFFSQLVSWTFPGEETGGIEAVLRHDRRQDDAPRRVASSRTARRATSTTRRRSSSGRTLEPSDVPLVQVAPGVYEAGSARSTRARTPSGSPRRGRGRRRWVARSGWSPRPRPSTGCWARTSRS